MDSQHLKIHCFDLFLFYDFLDAVILVKRLYFLVDLHLVAAPAGATVNPHDIPLLCSHIRACHAPSRSHHVAEKEV